MEIGYHIKCKKGDIAKNVIVVGDPGRATLASKMMEDVRLVNENRGLLTYTGRYGDLEVTVATHGMGAPSAAIVTEELLMLGAQNIIRVGTTGAIQPHIDVGDVVVPSGAIPLDGATREYVPEGFCPVPDFFLTKALCEAIDRRGLRKHVGLIATFDLFYAEASSAELWRRRNVLSVEMECSTIFVFASTRGLHAGAILAVDGNLVKGTMKGPFKPHEKKGEFDPKVKDAILLESKIALEAVKILDDWGVGKSA